MEHILFHLIVEAIQAIDRKLQRPLSVAVPELSQLRSEPDKYLKQNPITFGPRKRRVLATVIGIMIGLVAVAALLYTFSKMARPKQPQNVSRALGVLASFVAVAFVTRAVALRLLRGGSVTLRPQGAEFVHDSMSMFMPWDIFYTSGAMFEADNKNVVLPINPLVPVALSDDEGKVQAALPNDLDTPFAQFSDGQLSLKDLYDVRLTEFGALLFELGQRLGEPRNGIAPAWTQLPPLAVPEEKGWVRIHLTQLPFPPICAGCSEKTLDTLDVAVAAQNRTMTLALPFCRACTWKRNRIRWLAFAVGTLIGLFAGFVIPLLMVPNANRRPLLLLIMGLAFGVGVGLVAVLISSLVVRDRTVPIKLSEYKPDRATVKIRFRRPDRSAGLIEALGLPLRALTNSGKG